MRPKNRMSVFLPLFSVRAEQCGNEAGKPGKRHHKPGKDRIAEGESGAIDILVATDVAARGIDVSDIQVVFNYDITPDNDSYLHRIGRTGRAKKEGISFVLHSKDEQKRLDSIIHYNHSNIIPLEMDGWGTFQQIKK